MNFSSFEPILRAVLYQRPDEGLPWQTLLALISAITALVSSVVGPITSYKIARKQIVMTISTSEQKEWLQVLRTELATFFSRTLTLWFAIQAEKEPNLETRADQYQQLLTLETQIRLRLDVNKPTHRKVDELLVRITVAFTLKDFGEIEGALEPELEAFLIETRELINQELAEMRAL